MLKELIDWRIGRPVDRMTNFYYILDTQYLILFLLSLLAKQFKNREYKQ